MPETIVEQCHRLNVKVGDTIEGTEKYGTRWNTTRLTLLWLGEETAVWRETWRSNKSQEWSEPEESTSWTLDCREWRHVADATPPTRRNDMEWQPIETAPKDGTWILALNAITNKGRQHIVCYSTQGGDRFPWVGGSAPMTFVDGLTHWQPLPPPPAQPAGQEQP